MKSINTDNLHEVKVSDVVVAGYWWTVSGGTGQEFHVVRQFTVESVGKKSLKCRDKDNKLFTFTVTQSKTYICRSDQKNDRSSLCYSSLYKKEKTIEERIADLEKQISKKESKAMDLDCDMMEHETAIQELKEEQQAIDADVQDLKTEVDRLKAIRRNIPGTRTTLPMYIN